MLPLQDEGGDSREGSTISMGYVLRITPVDLTLADDMRLENPGRPFWRFQKRLGHRTPGKRPTHRRPRILVHLA